LPPRHRVTEKKRIENPLSLCASVAKLTSDLVVPTETQSHREFEFILLCASVPLWQKRKITVVEELEREYAPIKEKVHDLREYL
jgi:hypothetical protein